MDRAALVPAAAQVPVVVLGRAGLVVGEHLGVAVGVRRGPRVGARHRPRQGTRGGSRRLPLCGPAFGQRLVQPEPQEPVVAGLADAVGTELRPALEVVRAAARVGGPAPQAVEGRAERHGVARPYGPTGVHDPSGAMSTNASGSKISASSSIPSMTRGPGRLK